MTVRTSLLAIGLLVAAAPAWAANTAAPMAQGQTPAQQQKMPNAAPAAQPQMTAQQQKMRSCNAEASAKNLKADARNSFMSQCLKGGAAAPAVSAASTRQQGCTSQADAQKLAGAARTSFLKKCTAG